MTRITHVRVHNKALDGCHPRISSETVSLKKKRTGIKKHTYPQIILPLRTPIGVGYGGQNAFSDSVPGSSKGGPTVGLGRGVHSSGSGRAATMAKDRARMNAIFMIDAF